MCHCPSGPFHLLVLIDQAHTTDPMSSMDRCVERLLPCRPYEPKQQERRRGGQGRRAPARAAAGDTQQSIEGSIPPPLQLPLVDMVLSRTNMKAEAEVYIRCFHRVCDLGLGRGGVR